MISIQGREGHGENGRFRVLTRASRFPSWHRAVQPVAGTVAWTVRSECKPIIPHPASSHQIEPVNTSSTVTIGDTTCHPVTVPYMNAPLHARFCRLEGFVGFGVDCNGDLSLRLFDVLAQSPLFHLCPTGSDIPDGLPTTCASLLPPLITNGGIWRIGRYGGTERTACLSFRGARHII